MQASGATLLISEVVNPDDPNFIRLERYAQIILSVVINTDSQLVLDLRKVFVAYLSKYNTEKLPRGLLTHDSVHMNQAAG